MTELKISNRLVDVHELLVLVLAVHLAAVGHRRRRWPTDVSPLVEQDVSGLRLQKKMGLLFKNLLK